MKKRQVRLRVKESYRSLKTWDSSKFMDQHVLLKCFTPEELEDMALDYIDECIHKYGFTRYVHCYGNMHETGFFMEPIPKSD